MRPRRQTAGGASGQAEHLPLAAVARVVPNEGGGDCFYHALHGALTEQFHPKALHGPGSLREIVQKACAKTRTGNIKLMSGVTLVNFLKEKNMTLADLARRTTLAGKPGWAGIAEAAVLAEELPISIEIWQHSGRRSVSGYDALAKVHPRSGPTVKCARLKYNGRDHYEQMVLQVLGAPAPAPGATAAQPRPALPSPS